MTLAAPALADDPPPATTPVETTPAPTATVAVPTPDPAPPAAPAPKPSHHAVTRPVVQTVHPAPVVQAAPTPTMTPVAQVQSTPVATTPPPAAHPIVVHKAVKRKRHHRPLARHTVAPTPLFVATAWKPEPAPSLPSFATVAPSRSIAGTILAAVLGLAALILGIAALPRRALRPGLAQLVDGHRAGIASLGTSLLLATCLGLLIAHL